VFAVLVAPALLLRLATSVYPIMETFRLSLMNYNLTRRVQEYIGLANFREIATDATLQGVVGFTIMFIVISVLLQLVLGIFIANLLNSSFRGRGFVRTINLLPWIIPLIVSGYTFRWMFNGDYGLVSDLLSRLIGYRPSLLLDRTSARGTLILVNVWRNTPFMAIVLLAGLQSIPDELYESAKVDGANWWQRFRSITLPASTSMIVTLGLFNMIWQMSDIDLILGVTQGGPGNATMVIAYRIYQQGMLWFDWGIASAMSVVLIFLVAITGIIGLALFKKYEFSL
jgi:multiple sugar transport system permease protein